MNGIQLDIPSLSQHNATHDAYFDKDGFNRDLVERHGVIVYAGSSVSDGWCGRASASMIHNYFQRVAAYEAGEGESAARSRFIVNNRDRDSERPLDLIYPDDSVACHDGHSFFRLDEPLERAVSGWDDKTLLSDDERDAYDLNGDALPTLTEAEIQQELDPILRSLDRRTPVLAYTGLSTNNARPRHIIVVSGYRYDADGALWLHFTDPSTMRERGAGEKGPLLEPVDDATGEPERELLDVVKEGVWTTDESDGAGSKYWLKASRLFEERNEASSRDLLWLDHDSDRRPGLTVWIHPTYVTPPSPYASGGADVHLPVALPGADERPGTRLTADRAASAADAVDRAGQGGTFPVGQARTWHGGVHLSTGDAPERTRTAASGVIDRRRAHAMLAGEVVAARLTDPDQIDTPLGSPNFVLMRHDVERLVDRVLGPHASAGDPADGSALDDGKSGSLFSLTMHLAPERITEEAAQRIPWLRGEPTAFATRRPTPFYSQPRPTDNRVVAKLDNGFQFVSLARVRGYGAYHKADWHVFDLGAVLPPEVAPASNTPPPWWTTLLQDRPADEAQRDARTHNADRVELTEAYRPNSHPALVQEAGVASDDRFNLDGVHNNIIGPLVCVHPAYVRPATKGPLSPATTGFVYAIHGVNEFMPVRRVPTGRDDGRRGTFGEGTELALLEDDAAPTGWSAVTGGKPDPVYVRTADLTASTWALNPDVAEALSGGTIAVFDDPPRVRAGEAIGAVGTSGRAESPTHPETAMVHVEMFSTGEESLYRRIAEHLVQSYTEDRAGPNASALFDWAEVDGTPEGVHASMASVREALQNPSFATPGAELQEPTGTRHSGHTPHLLADPPPRREALRAFFARSPDAERLRTYACKLVNEWTEQPRAYALAHPDDYAPFLWWDAVASEGNALPVDGAVWHYHPIRLGQLLAEPPAPAHKAPRVQQVDGPSHVVAGRPAVYTARLKNASDTAQPGLRWQVQVWRQTSLGEMVGAWKTDAPMPTSVEAVLLERVAGPRLTWTPSARRLHTEYPTEDGTLRVRVQAQTVARADDGEEPCFGGRFTQVVSGPHQIPEDQQAAFREHAMHARSR